MYLGFWNKSMANVPLIFIFNVDVQHSSTIHWKISLRQKQPHSQGAVIYLGLPYFKTLLFLLSCPLVFKKNIKRNLHFVPAVTPASSSATQATAEQFSLAQATLPLAQTKVVYVQGRGAALPTLMIQRCRQWLRLVLTALSELLLWLSSPPGKLPHQFWESVSREIHVLFTFLTCTRFHASWSLRASIVIKRSFSSTPTSGRCPLAGTPLAFCISLILISYLTHLCSSFLPTHVSGEIKLVIFLYTLAGILRQLPRWICWMKDL